MLMLPTLLLRELPIMNSIVGIIVSSMPFGENDSGTAKITFLFKASINGSTVISRQFLFSHST